MARVDLVLFKVKMGKITAVLEETDGELGEDGTWDSGHWGNGRRIEEDIHTEGKANLT